MEGPFKRWTGGPEVVVNRHIPICRRGWLGVEPGPATLQPTVVLAIGVRDLPAEAAAARTGTQSRMYSLYDGLTTRRKPITPISPRKLTPSTAMGDSSNSGLFATRQGGAAGPALPGAKEWPAP